MLIGFPYFVVIYALPSRFQVVNERSSLASGVALLPLLGSSAIGSTLAGIVLRKEKQYVLDDDVRCGSDVDWNRFTIYAAKLKQHSGSNLWTRSLCWVWLRIDYQYFEPYCSNGQ
jgi:hypothetical protein